MSQKAKPVSPKAKVKSKICDLCAGAIKHTEDLVKCQGPCEQYMHRYCAGVTRHNYQQLKTSSTPFKCLVCSVEDHKQTLASLITAAEGITKELSLLKSQIDLKETQITVLQSKMDFLIEQGNPECPCQATVTGIQNDVQQLQSNIAGQRPLYADIANSKLKNPSRNPNLRSQPPKAIVQGSRKIWGTRKRTDIAVISNEIAKIPNADSLLSNLLVKRKYKSSNSARRTNKWWFVVRAEESQLKVLEDNWDRVKQETGWQLEHVYCFKDPPKDSPTDRVDSSTAEEEPTQNSLSTPSPPSPNNPIMNGEDFLERT